MAFLRFSSLVCAVSLSIGVVACGASENGSGSDGSGSPTPGAPSDPSDPSRAITEADIVQLDGGLLYAMSKSGTVSVVDASKPGHLAMLGQVTIAGQPFEMYRRGDLLVTMSNGAIGNDGSPSTASTQIDTGAGALVSVLDVHDPAHIVQRSSFPVTGEIADSRFVGDVLYLATYENSQCQGCGTAPRTLVTSFDFSDPTQLKPVNQASFQSNAPDSYNLPWGTNWKRSIFVTDQRLYIGGHADVDPSSYDTTSHEGIIDVLDISDPTGHLKTIDRLEVAGALLSRWQIDESDGVLRVITQKGAGRTGNGVAMPEIATFSITEDQKFVPLATRSLELPMQEGLRTVRFDGDRAYAITYNQTDPLFAIDLSDPMNPRQRGQLKMPGFMFYLEPHGDRVIGLGIDRDDPGGSLNVSLFDVSDMDDPTMIERVPFASDSFNEDFEILNGELPEDQDRIQKAFHAYEDGLVVVPFSSGEGCSDPGSGVEVIDWKNDTLTERAFLPLPGNPRRALENGQELLTVSDSNVRSFELGKGSSVETADLGIGSCVAKSDGYGYPVGGDGYNDGYGDDGGGMFCSVSSMPSSPSSGIVVVIGLCLLGFAGVTRKK